jgi:pimeloyl-ACP methyl ester carboxylesterase
MQTRTIQTDGLRQQILEAGSGPLVLLIHGFPELGLSWRAQVQALADAGYHAVAPDMRGYGASGGTFDLWAREVNDIWDMVQLARSSHADKIDMRPGSGGMDGYSAGGCHTLSCLVKFPDLFSFYAPHFPITNPAEWHPETSAPFRAHLETALGGTPGAVPNAYAARTPRDAVPYVLR